MRRIVTTLFVTLAFASGGGLTVTAAATDSGGPDNIVNLSTSGTGAVQERSSVKVGSYAGDDLQSANVARADSHDCTDCRTSAVAVQAVFATGHPHTVRPANVALATNENCTRCATFAWAYQYVVLTSGPVHLSGDDRGRLADIRERIDEVTHSGEPPAQMDAELQQLAAQFKAQIDAGLRHSGEHGRGQVRQDESETPAG